MIAKYVLAPRIPNSEKNVAHTLFISYYYAGKEGAIRLRTALPLVLSAMWDTILPPFSMTWTLFFCKHYFKMLLKGKLLHYFGVRVTIVNNGEVFYD